MVNPRFAWVPPCARSLGEEAIAWWEAAGGVLFEWQKMVIIGMLGLTTAGRWASSEDGLDVARQNGKGVVLQVIEGFFAFELHYPVVMHTAHEFATSQEHQFRLEDVIQNTPHLHARVKKSGGYKHANGQESINLADGSRIIFKARTKMGARGYSGDLLVWDEAMVVPDTVVGSMLPMLRASKTVHGPKVIYAGSAVDQEIHEYGVNFARIRERGLAKATRVSWHEWSAPFDHPSEMTTDLLRDRSWWPVANPSMEEGLVSEEYMADEIDRMPSRTAAVELGSVGDWPSTDGSAGEVISAAKWDSLADGRAGALMLDPVCLAFDVTPDRSSASIGAAGFRADGLPQVELIERRRGTGWIAARLADLEVTHGPRAILYDALGPAASLVPEIEAAGVKVKKMSTREYVDACGIIFDAVDESRLRHRGDPDLDATVKAARAKPTSEAWLWSRTKSAGDITPLVACTLALWGVMVEPASVYEERGLLVLGPGR